MSQTTVGLPGHCTSLTVAACVTPGEVSPQNSEEYNVAVI